MRSIEAGLTRLGLSRLDVVLIHDAAEDPHGAAWPARFAEAMAGAAPVLTRLREEGVIRAWGLGVNNVEPCLLALGQADPDLFLIAGRYTLLEQGSVAAAAAGLRRAWRRPDHRRAVQLGPAGGRHRLQLRARPAALVARRDRLAGLCAEHGVPLKAAALQFCAAPQVVASVIPGARSVAEVTENIQMMRLPIPPGFWQALRAAELVPAAAELPG